MSSCVQVEFLRDGSVARVVLARPPANILDAEMMAGLREAFAAVAGRPGVRLVLFDSAGKHFSFGASVAEHLPGQVRDMLTGFHALFRALEALGVPTAAAVRGQCLGGAAELLLWAGTVHAHPQATIGFPEVKLAVFPPIAAAALRLRVPPALATRLVTTGQTVSGAHAVEVGLCDAVSDDPLATLLAWHDEALAPLSPAALRHAWRASRGPWQRILADEIPALEAQYLDELMSHPDALEGLQAFLDKRAPRWSDQ